ncbi:MAG: ATP synthase subunit C [Lachnospiraceae bacterium]|jgi:V/A-type H+-transporting ATPase subunit K|nr:ATP synthase subunit C [Lachnospiraceae bacterium]
MTIITKLILIAALILSIILPFGYFLIGERNKKRYKRTLGVNVFFFFGACVVAAIMMFSATPALASEATTPISASLTGGSSATGLGYLAAALSTGLSCVGGGIAVASAASAALGAISEDSSALGKSLIFVGLAEGVCLYGLIISFMILGKL